jgi:hypothetical protein
MGNGTTTARSNPQQTSQQQQVTEEEGKNAFLGTYGKDFENFKKNPQFKDQINKIEKKFGMTDQQAENLLLVWYGFLKKAGLNDKQIADLFKNHVVGSQAFVKAILNGEAGEKAAELLKKLGTTEFQSSVGSGGSGAALSDIQKSNLEKIGNDARTMSFDEFYNKYKDQPFIITALREFDKEYDRLNDEEKRKRLMAFIWMIYQMFKVTEKPEEEKKEEKPQQQTEEKKKGKGQKQQQQRTYDLTTENGRREFANEVLLNEKGDVIKYLRSKHVNIEAYRTAINNYIKNDGSIELYFEVLPTQRKEDKKNRALDVANYLKRVFSTAGYNVEIRGPEDSNVQKGNTTVQAQRVTITPIIEQEDSGQTKKQDKNKKNK